MTDTYLSDRPCKDGHLIRYVKWHTCVVCARIRARKSYIPKTRKPRNEPHVLARNAARERGELTYFTGSPCRRGHIAPRRTYNDTCLECERVRRTENHTRVRQWAKNWYYRNQEKAARWSKEYRTRTADARKAAYARWRAANKEARRESNAADYRAKREHILKRVRAWREANPLARKAIVSRYRARKKNAAGTHTGEDIQNILKAQRGRCATCNIKLRKRFHVDHVIPLSLGGSNDRRNLQLLCPSCNCSKGAKHPIAFAQERGRLL